jgi:hypothetical protein
MRYCKLCSGPLPLKITVDGKVHNLQNRHYCLTCSPFGLHNTRRLMEQRTEEERERRRKESDRAKFRKYQRKTRHQRKRLLIRFLGGYCQICGYNRDCPAAYDFHHRDPDTKKFDIGSRGLLRRLDELIAEAKKCVLLCCRCHREVHAGLHNDWELQWQGQVAQQVARRAENA